MGIYTICCIDQQSWLIWPFTTRIVRSFVANPNLDLHLPHPGWEVESNILEISTIQSLQRDLLCRPMERSPPWVAWSFHGMKSFRSNSEKKEHCLAKQLHFPKRQDVFLGDFQNKHLGLATPGSCFCVVTWGFPRYLWREITGFSLANLCLFDALHGPLCPGVKWWTH